MPHSHVRAVKEQKSAKAPLRFGDDNLLWASWLYYEEGMTQSEIADAMKISRPTVNAYLADARAKGIVNISISGAKLGALTLARAIEEKFDLSDCLVIPVEDGGRSLIDTLGAATAGALGRFLHSGDTIGITWGRTMLAVASRVRIPDLIDIKVVQATGGTTASIGYTPEACATRLAEALSAQFVPISAPAIVSSAGAREILLNEPVIAEQLGQLATLDRILFGVSSLRPNSTIHTSGFFDNVLQQHDFYSSAAGSLAGRFIDANGREVEGPLGERTIGIGLDQLRRVKTRILVAGGFDKVPAILAALRGGYVSALITDSATGQGILRAAGVELDDGIRRVAPQAEQPADQFTRSRVKKLINLPRDAVNEAVEGALAAHGDVIEPIGGDLRALRAAAPRREGKVGLVIGGGAGHEPSFLGFVGAGLADAVAIGNIFASPPPDRVLTCTRDADRGAGVLYIYGNYTGDVMNFDMAADLASAEGIEVRTILTTDDVASSNFEDRDGRRGTAGNVFVFKIAGAACARMHDLDECARIARKANAACFTLGVALEPCSLPETQRPSFRLGPDDLEFGVGIHGEPGVARQPLQPADRIADQICNRLFAEANIDKGARVALLVNSLGATPMLELLILNRRVRQRLDARGVTVEQTLVGHYCTSLDMVGASITMMKLDDELAELLRDPCHGFALTVGKGGTSAATGAAGRD